MWPSQPRSHLDRRGRTARGAGLISYCSRLTGAVAEGNVERLHQGGGFQRKSPQRGAITRSSRRAAEQQTAAVECLGERQPRSSAGYFTPDNGLSCQHSDGHADNGFAPRSVTPATCCGRPQPLPSCPTKSILDGLQCSDSCRPSHQAPRSVSRAKRFPSYYSTGL